jgi:hypothetical protein
MNRKELKLKLDEMGIDSNSYSLNGDLLPDRIVLYHSYSKWEVFYFNERGSREGVTFFDSEDAACGSIYEDFRQLSLISESSSESS